MSNPIQTHFVILCNKLDVDKILPYLRAEKMVTSEEYETFLSESIPKKQKRERLLIMMPRKGTNFFRNFSNCLVWSGQTELAKRIGVDLSTVPKSPHSDPDDDSFETERPQVFRSDYPPIPTPAPVPPQPNLPVIPPKVFILYHKDPGLEQSHGITVQDFADKILDMSHILHSVGGFEVSVDMYEKADIDNWNVWTEQKIEESKYVVLILSPGFGRALKNPRENNQLDTEKGSFFATNVTILVSTKTEKFIPTFLSNCVDEQWIPTSLLTSPKYTLDVDKMVDSITADPDTQPQLYLQQVHAALETQHFDDWRRLIHHLRGQNYEVPPPRAEPPLPIAMDFVNAQPLATGSSQHRSPQASVPKHRYISHEDLLKIAQTVAKEWKSLGMSLGLQSSDLEAIGHIHQDPIAACMAMFGMWQREAGADRKTLKTVLVTLGFGKIAKTLFPAD